MRYFCLSIFVAIQLDSVLASADDVSDAIVQLNDADPEVRYQAARSLRRLGNRDERTISVLITALADAGAPTEYDIQYLGPRVNDAASATLARIGKPAVPSLIRALEGENQTVRAMAARTLGEIGPAARNAFPALQRLLETTSKEADTAWIGWDATRAISKIGIEPDVAVPVLYHVFQTGESDWPRTTALEALHDADPSGRLAIPILIEAMAHEDGDIMSAAVRTLESFGRASQTAVPELLDGLSTTKLRWDSFADVGFQVPVRRDVARTLGSIGPAARVAVPRLMQMMEQDSDKQTRAEAAASLCRICPDERAVTRPAFAFIISSKAYSALGTIGSDTAVAELRNVLNTEDATEWRQNHRAAVDALTEAGANAAPAVPELRLLIVTEQKKDEDIADFFLRRSAIIALGQIGKGSSKAIPELKRIANHPGDDISDWNMSDLAEEAIQSIQKSMRKDGEQRQN